MLHDPTWRYLLDCPHVMDVLDSIYAASGGYKFVGGGGDFVLPGTTKYQALHADLGPSKVPAPLRVRNPPPVIVINFAIQPIDALNGPMRIIPDKMRVDHLDKSGFEPR